MAEFCGRLNVLVHNDLEKMMGRAFHNRHLWLCLLADFLLIQLVIGPSNVLVWRGAWELYIRMFGAEGRNAPLLILAGLTLSLLVILVSPELARAATRLLESQAGRWRRWWWRCAGR